VVGDGDATVPVVVAPPRRSRTPLIIGMVVAGAVYGAFGVSTLWWRGVPLVGSVLVAGVGVGTAIVVALLVDRIMWGRRGRTLVALVAAHLMVGVAMLAASAALPSLCDPQFGDPGDRVVSPDGRFEVVTYDWSAMIDPGWTMVVERVDGGDREWFWLGAESPAPVEVRFVAPTGIEVQDDYGQVWALTFDPDTLEPSERYCVRPEYCYRWPFDGYTRTSPAGT
jgi:hypothetical protein